MPIGVGVQNKRTTAGLYPALCSKHVNCTGNKGELIGSFSYIPAMALSINTTDGHSDDAMQCPSMSMYLLRTVLAGTVLAA